MEAGDEQKDPLLVFELISKLGEGSYGSVVKARHRKNGAFFAIKLVPIEENETLAELMREVDVMRALQSPYILRQYCTYVRDNLLWIVLEYCPGGSVSDYMRVCKRTFGEAHIASVARDMLHGLDYLHGQRKIHRDIKSGNVLLAADGKAKLADFGVAGQLSDRTVKRMTLTGTPYWMAPEVVMESGYDSKADIWSLGITCIEMADGKPPYHTVRPMLAMVMIPSKPPPTLTNELSYSATFRDFVAKCLVKDPAQRPTAAVLLKHPFLATAADLTSLVLEEIKLIETSGLGLDDGEDDEDEEADDGTQQFATVRASDATVRSSASSTVSTVDDATVRVSRTVPRGPATRNDDGTVRRYNDTVKAGDSDTVKARGRLDMPNGARPWPEIIRRCRARDDSQRALAERTPFQLLQDAVQRLNLDDSSSQGLVYIYSPDGTECYEFHVNQRPLTICRESSAAPIVNSIAFDTRVMSRTHAAIHMDKGAFFICDVGSSSGTFLNRKRLSDVKQSSPLSVLVPGDAVQLGQSLTEDNQPVPFDEDDSNIAPSRRAVHLRVLFVERDSLYLSADMEMSSTNPLSP